MKKNKGNILTIVIGLIVVIALCVGGFFIIKHFTGIHVTLNSDMKFEITFDTKSNVKWFSIFKPLLTNNLFNNSPFGIPHYANAIDNLKAVDITFDAIKNEINDGRKRIFARIA